MDDAISKAIDAHEAAMHQDFGGPGLFDWDGEHCARECLEAQLKAFYTSMNCKPVPTTKTGGMGTATGSDGAVGL